MGKCEPTTRGANRRSPGSHTALEHDDGASKATTGRQLRPRDTLNPSLVRKNDGDVIHVAPSTSTTFSAPATTTSAPSSARAPRATRSTRTPRSTIAPSKVVKQTKGKKSTKAKKSNVEKSNAKKSKGNENNNNDDEDDDDDDGDDDEDVWHPIKAVLQHGWTAEGDIEYKVDWIGKDKSGKPWRPSYVPPSHVTRDMIKEYHDNLEADDYEEIEEREAERRREQAGGASDHENQDATMSDVMRDEASAQEHGSDGVSGPGRHQGHEHTSHVSRAQVVGLDAAHGSQRDGRVQQVGSLAINHIFATRNEA